MSVGTKRPLKKILSAHLKTTEHRSKVWGLTLECGHYVERVDKPKHSARCGQCAAGVPVYTPAVEMCECASRATCKSCWGFGHVEAVLSSGDYIGGVPGDHIGCIYVISVIGADVYKLGVAGKR